MRTNSADWSALIPVLPGEGPRTRQLYAAIRELIETGAVPPGSKLPTTRDLSRRFALSRACAVAAFDMLVADGFAQARVGAGTFVARHVPRVNAPVEALPLPDSVAAPLPGDIGVASRDERTMRTLRGLIGRNLARPGPEHFSYGDPRGSLKLRRAIASYLRMARGVRCDAEQIVITTGTRHGVDLAARTLIRPGDVVWVEDPCYYVARTTLEMAGARLVGVPVDAEGLDPAYGEEKHTRARLVYVTPSHQFPLGVTMTMRRRLALLDWARRHGAWIIEDDYDSEFRFAGPPLTSMQGMDGSDRVLYLGTFAKVLFPGIRIGYAVVPRPLLETFLRHRIQTDRQPPTLTEGAIADFLDEGHLAAHLRRARRYAQAARDAFVTALARDCGSWIDVAPPEQGLHLVAGLKGGLSDARIGPALRAVGVGGRALAPMYLDAARRQGLVLGFSGFAPSALAEAATKIAQVLQAFPARQN